MKFEIKKQLNSFKNFLYILTGMKNINLIGSQIVKDGLRQTKNREFIFEQMLIIVLVQSWSVGCFRWSFLKDMHTYVQKP